ncbi:hypothetical protein PoB_003967400 [Plakobranchus ocellatus]|uniref:Uncharacterized protein n=1 Tax=Plakobranchus ocellatus TaxID=259542 RepID=A0AAV4B466_9GAST|nr:hypothetical protein PoB_003967400 [Plakobranchus ocellatus]
MFPWDDRGDGHPSDTTLLNTLAPVLVAHGLLTHASLQQSDLRLLGHLSDQGTGSGARNCAGRVPADLRADLLATVQPMPLFVERSISRLDIICSILKVLTPSQTPHNT